MKQDKYDVTLLSTFSDKYKRISIHGVRESLIEKQAMSLRCRLEKVYIPPECTNEEYEEIMGEATNRFKMLGIKKIAFGDIYLEDIRRYREKNLQKSGMEAVFPLWGRNPRELADTFIALNFKSIITCVDTEVLSGDFTGRYYDKSFLADLPEGIDPCGENGEFHSFAFDGPIFKEKIHFSVGEKYLDAGRFQFCDLEVV